MYSKKTIYLDRLISLRRRLTVKYGLLFIGAGKEGHLLRSLTHYPLGQC